MKRLFYAVVVGLVGAGIVHLAILLLMPVLSDRDAWSALSRAGPTYSVVPLAGGDLAVPGLDPSLRAVACRFDLSDDVAHVSAEGRLPFWSASVFDDRGSIRYSFNDRTAVEGMLDLVVATPAQLIDLRKTMPAPFEDSVFVETNALEGYVVLRVLEADPTWQAQVEAWITGLRCRPGGEE